MEGVGLELPQPGAAGRAGGLPWAPSHGPPQPGTTIQGPFRSLCGEGRGPAPSLTRPPLLPALALHTRSFSSSQTKLHEGEIRGPTSSELLRCSHYESSPSSALDPFLLLNLLPQFFLLSGSPISHTDVSHTVRTTLGGRSNYIPAQLTTGQLPSLCLPESHQSPGIAVTVVSIQTRPSGSLHKEESSGAWPPVERAGAHSGGTQ